MYISLHAKYPLFLRDFGETWIFSTDFRKKYSNIKFHEKSVQWEPSCSCGRTHRHDEANNRFSAILQTRLKRGAKCLPPIANHIIRQALSTQWEAQCLFKSRDNFHCLRASWDCICGSVASDLPVIISWMPNGYEALVQWELAGRTEELWRKTVPVPVRLSQLEHGLSWERGTAVAQWLKCCATSQKVAGSIPADVIGFFSDIKSFRSHYGPGIDSASNINEYQEYFLRVKAAGA